MGKWIEGDDDNTKPRFIRSFEDNCILLGMAYTMTT
jgi:hypothetical protein